MRTSLTLIATFAVVYLVPSYLLAGFLRARRIDPAVAAIVLWAASTATYIALRRLFGQRLPRV